MVRGVVLTEHDVSAWTHRYHRGEAPAALPYGVDALEAVGWHLAWGHSKIPKSWEKPRRLVEHRLGYPIVQTISSSAHVARSDCVIALLEQQGLAAARWKRLGAFPYSRRPLIIFSCWLADDLTALSSTGRRELVARYASADLITHLSPQETDVLVDSGLSREQLYPVTYGVSAGYYVPDPAIVKDIDVLSVGQDRGRDYATLFAAVRGSDITVDLVCKAENIEHLERPDNVRMHGTVTLSQYRRLLQRAKVVVVPTTARRYPTGSSVALEAAASGACVVTTGTPTMSEIFTDGVNAILPPLGDAGALHDALRTALMDDAFRGRLGAAARTLVEDERNSDRMWSDLSRELGNRGILSSV